MTRRDALFALTIAAARAWPASATNSARQVAANLTDPSPSIPSSPRLHYYYPLPEPKTAMSIDMDLCIYGATPAGISAAIQARRMNKTVILLSFDRHLGGMTSSGLGATDIGNKAAIGGIAREFYRRLGQHYGAPEAWTFEPSVAEETLRAFCRANGVRWLYEQRLTAVRREGARIAAITTEGGHTFSARYFIDASYEGDLMARAGVSYSVGREANSEFGETLNGVHFGHPNHNFVEPTDPWVTPGDPNSGLLPGISADPPGEQGTGDHRVQAYNFRLCMTQADNRLPFHRPDGYDPMRYELLARYINARGGKTDALDLTVKVPNGKTDTNNFGGFSSDNIGRNYGWPDGDYGAREQIFQDHVVYQQGLMWFLSHDERVPNAIRDVVKTWGMPSDEFVETGGWPHQLYVREARRMRGDQVMTEHHCTHAEAVTDSIALAAYQMDSHNCQRIARQEKGGWTARNEGNVEVQPAAPYGISYRALTPKASECENLLVPVCLSATHIAYGSIRMEPVFFVLGQSAATAACLALDAGNLPVQHVNTAALRARLRADGQILDWNPIARAAPAV